MLATACGFTADTETTPADGLVGVVANVADGDSIDVDTDGGQIEVRLLGVNAPDRGECFADESRDFLADTLTGRSVTLDVRGEDQFDRVLAVVLLDGLDINRRLVELGLALATTPGEGDGSSDGYVTAERAAYEDGIGLWGQSACGPGSSAEIEFDPGSSMPNPAGPDDDVLSSEGVTLVNLDSVAAEISGWVIRDESSRHRYVLPSGTTMSPGSVLFVSSADPGWSPGGSPVWNNGGDVALLLDQNGNVVARWRY